MKIGILYQDIRYQTIPWQKNQEIYNRTAHRVEEMAKTLTEMGYETTIFSSLYDCLNQASYIDLVFPCIECCFERNTNGFIQSILQMKRIPFIGNDSYINTIASDKYLFKNIVTSLGIRTPKSKLIYKLDSQTLSDIIQDIKIPCILKYQYGSMSYHTIKISDLEHFKNHVLFMLNQNNGPILCEEYIEGHEISVPVIGTAPNEQILAVIEYTDFNNEPLDIYDEYWKGKNDSQVELKALNHSILSTQEIIHSVHQVYRYLNYHDYARFDFRLDYQGKPFLLEGNPLPALAYESAFDPKSYGQDVSFGTILSDIVKSAIKRYDLNCPKN